MAACSDGGGGGRGSRADGGNGSPADAGRVDATPRADAAPTDAAPVADCEGISVEEIEILADTLPTAIAIGPAGLIEVGGTQLQGPRSVVLVARDDSGWRQSIGPTGEVSGGVTMLRSADGALNVFWTSAYGEFKNADIVFASRLSEDAAWTRAANLTAPFESDLERFAYAGQPAIGPDGEVIVAYQSALLPWGSSILIEEIRVITVKQGEVMSGPFTVIPLNGISGCYGRVSTVFDAAGSLYVTSVCTDDTPETTFAYLAVRNGTGWQEDIPVVNNPAGSLRLATAGEVTHGVWKAVTCDEQSDACQETRHATLGDGGFSAPQTIRGMPGIGLNFEIAAGPADRVRIVAGGEAIYLSDSPDGTTFPNACRQALPEPGWVAIQALEVGPDGVVHAIALWTDDQSPSEATRVFYLAIP